MLLITPLRVHGIRVLVSTAPESTIATTTIGAVNSDNTIVQNEFDSDILYYDVTAEVDVEGSRVQVVTHSHIRSHLVIETEFRAVHSA